MLSGKVFAHVTDKSTSRKLNRVTPEEVIVNADAESSGGDDRHSVIVVDGASVDDGSVSDAVVEVRDTLLYHFKEMPFSTSFVPNYAVHPLRKRRFFYVKSMVVRTC